MDLSIASQVRSVQEHNTQVIDLKLSSDDIHVNYSYMKQNAAGLPAIDGVADAACVVGDRQRTKHAAPLVTHASVRKPCVDENHSSKCKPAFRARTTLRKVVQPS